MRKIVSVAAAAALMTATIPAWSQTTTSPSSKSDQQMQKAPGSGGTSKPGVSGQAGNKSGPAAKDHSSGSSSMGTSGSSTPPSALPSQDSSKVQGLPGNKSGPSQRAPGEKSSGSGSSDSTTGTKSR
jgi:hypothetical protein